MIAARAVWLASICGSVLGCGGGAGSGLQGGNSATPTVATPAFTPAGGAYSLAQSVTITDATADAKIYYTVDGSTPGAASTRYAGPISVSSTTTIKAIATVTGEMSSAIATATYSFASGGHKYSTAFQSTEDPISEGGEWINGGARGLDWHDCQTTGGSPGRASGTEPGTVNYDDSTCVLAGTWAQNQSAQATVKVGSLAANTDEVELRLNTTITPHSITGYEINCSLVSLTPYLQIVRWDGTFGNFLVLKTVAVSCSEGDTLTAVRSGATITVSKNGVVEATVTDSTYTNGSPGMGFYISNLNGTAAAANAGFGFSLFSASD